MKLTKYFFTGFLTLCTLSIQAKNTKTTVKQVSDSIAITDDVDYIISDATAPFIDGGKVNIINTDHAVVIIKSIRPSTVISQWLKKYVLIDGKTAVNGSNCQVRMYNRGAIILPYAKTIRPLTCYTEENYGGKEYTNYTEGSDGGFMKTLTSTSLNNNIRSFKLKRGYMVTFAVGKGGWGYSRCFIADSEDLEIPVMPEPFKGTISSYRLFQWYNASKAGVHDTDAKVNAALGTTSCFDWAQGNASLLPDVEWVPNHIYEDWPSAATCGSVTGSCHMKTNNEPGNSADDHPQDVATVLGNWQNLMRTGMRLCSESSHDGSMGHLKEFITEIDKRGWRCDILDLHCYWDAGTFNSLNWYSDTYGNGRPIWISEWVWGASWNKNGAFASGRQSDDATYTGTKPILDILNSNTRVERYYYWNSEASYTKIYRDGQLTKLGEYYASMNVSLGYNPANEYIPRIVYQATENLKSTYNATSKTLAIKWTDDNGDMLDSMCVEVMRPGETEYVQVKNVTLKDKAAKGANSYSFNLSNVEESGFYRYRIANYPQGSKTATYTEDLAIIGGEQADYYLKNETGTFMQQGGKWGTQATLGTTGQLMSVLIANDKVIFNTGIETEEGKSYLGSNGYMDAESFTWTITPIGEDAEGTLYNIANGTSFIGAAEGSNIVSLDLTDGNAPEAKWRLVTKAQRNAQLLTATPEQPVEATYLLSNPNFNRSQPIDAWKGDGAVGGDDANRCMEKYNTTFDVYQEVSGLPKGKYLLTCQGFYRNGTSTTSKVRNAYLYANDDKVQLMSIAGETGTKPNTMSTASAAFTKGKYSNNKLEFELNGKLRFGVKKETAVSEDWTIFDNFQLFYLQPDESVGIITTPTHTEKQAFNLQGMPVDIKKMKHGLYIVNGKKVLIK